MRKRLSAALAAVLIMLATTGAQAQLVVRKSDDTIYPRKMVIEAKDTIAIPKGKTVQVMLPDGTTRDLTAANNGKAATVLKGSEPEVPWWKELLQHLKSGGASTKDGAARKPRVGAGPAIYTVEGVGGGAESVRVCVAQGSMPVIGRDQTAARHPVQVVAEANAKLRGVAYFEEGKVQVSWPAGVAVEVGKSYRIMPANAAPLVIEVRAIPRGLTGDARIQALGAASCLAQVLITD